MRVVRNDDLYIATHVSGPTHNLLGLDFTHGKEPYEQNLSESPSATDAESIRQQVLKAFNDEGIDATMLVGIQFNSEDTPSESVYYELAKAILQQRPTETRATLTSQNERTVRVVSALLYSFDPAGMGMSVFAPEDEYDPAAAGLVSELRTAEDPTAQVRHHYPEAPDLMINAIVDAVGLSQQD